MSVFGNIMLAAALASTTVAFAATSHLSDSQYIAAARCQGLFDSKALGAANASGINSLIKAEGSSRNPTVFQMADDARSNASRQARNAGAVGRSTLISERDGACQAFSNLGGASDRASN